MCEADGASETASAGSKAAAADDGVTTVVLATASPAKFPETVREATGRDAGLPDHASDVLAASEIFERIEPSLGAVHERVGKLAR